MRGDIRILRSRVSKLRLPSYLLTRPTPRDELAKVSSLFATRWSSEVSNALSRGKSQSLTLPACVILGGVQSLTQRVGQARLVALYPGINSSV
ncbi:hypothetical protein QYF36_009279 [Acer negundo]|nr:hypothetical protein QYF36_009279 [Acer negundo]